MKTFISKHGHGFGRITADDKAIEKVLETLTKEQLQALMDIVLLGDIHETALHPDILGDWIPKNIMELDSESELRLSIAASILYLADKSLKDCE